MRSLLAALLCATAVAAPAGAVPIEFVVSGLYGDSYVLVLEDPDDIAHARDLIQNGPSIGATIVIAEIAAGPDGRNRDVYAEGEPLWSWRVTEFTGFADFAIELCDGWPGYVEQDVEGWIANTGGTICFWSYTVVEELPEPEVAQGIAVGFVALLLAARRRAR